MNWKHTEDKLKEDQIEELLCEWKKFKYNLLILLKEVPPELSRSVAAGKLTWNQKAYFQDAN